MIEIRAIFKPNIANKEKEMARLKLDIRDNIGIAARYSYSENDFFLVSFDMNSITMAVFFMECSNMFSEIKLEEP